MTRPLPLSAYGKLPLSREFLSLGCEAAAAKEFCDYLHACARHMAGLPADRGMAIRLYRTAGNGRAFVAATLWPSADEGGARAFPFSLFATCSVGGTVPLDGGFCTAFGALHALHESAFERLVTLPDAHAFEQFVRGELAATDPPLANDPAEALFRERAATYPTGRWAAALYGTQARTFLVGLWRLVRLQRAARGSFASLAGQYAGVRVPLLRGHLLEAQADAWLKLLMRGREEAAPNVVLGRFGPDDRATLAVYFRTLEPDDLAILTEQPDRGLIDLASYKEPADMEGFESFCAGLRERLLTSHATLERFPSILEGLGDEP